MVEEPSFEYFMNLAMALEADVKKSKLEMLRNYINGSSVAVASKKYGFSPSKGRNIIVTTAERLMRKSGQNERRVSFDLYIRDMRYFKSPLLKRIFNELKN